MNRDSFCLPWTNKGEGKHAVMEAMSTWKENNKLDQKNMTENKFEIIN